MAHVPHLRRDHIGTGGTGEVEKLVALVRADIADDASVAGRVPEPLGSLGRMNAMRPKTDRLHDPADRAAPHELSSVHRGAVLESFAVHDRVDPPRCRLYSPHFGQLLERRDTRLVDHV